MNLDADYLSALIELFYMLVYGWMIVPFVSDQIRRALGYESGW